MSEPQVDLAGARDRGFDSAQAGRFATMVLDAIFREYPNRVLYTLGGDADARPPRELTPAFYGCFDWHSAVHGHWTLCRLLRLFPDAGCESRITAALARSFDPSTIAGELAFVESPLRRGFEVPYGMAWLLTVDAELHELGDARARAWRSAIAPLAAHAAERIAEWARCLPYPVRTGEHGQSAFGLALFLDWARRTGQTELEARTQQRVLELYAGDRDGPLHLEPSGYDFLSPCLAEADLMRRVLAPAELADWLSRFLPGIPRDGGDAWLAPVSCPDPSDGKLAHLDGLNLSRAWMLDGIAAGLAIDDPRRPALGAAARRHAERGLPAVTGEHYAGSHWQASFAVYLLTGRGLP